MQILASRLFEVSNKRLKKTLSLLELDVEPLFVRPVDLVTLPNKFMELFKYINTYI